MTDHTSAEYVALGDAWVKDREEWRERAETAERELAAIPADRVEAANEIACLTVENRRLRDALMLAAERVRLAHVRQPCQAGDCGICAHLAEWAALAEETRDD